MNRQSAASATRALAAISAGLLSLPAFAHTGEHHTPATLLSGFTHPLIGWDHLLAMLAIGIWAAQQKSLLKWSLPVLFPVMMAAGALAAFGGLPIPAAEAGIAASLLVLGLLIFFAARLPGWTSALLVSVFGVFHGYAHGLELPPGAAPGLYAVGFLLSTAMLHAAGFATAFFFQRGTLIRAGGLAVSGAGVCLLAASV